MISKQILMRPLVMLVALCGGLVGVACADLAASRDNEAVSHPAAGLSGAANAATEERAVDILPRDALVIRTADGRDHDFIVELAATPEERARGLMFRRSMPEDAGMIFDYGREARVAMWMKNTFIPLDMLFIDGDGVIRHIRENAVPHDETPISSVVPVRAVLELNGGTVARLGIGVNDRVEHKIFASHTVPAE